ncbi:MAG: trehalose-phosphatase [Deltaproteobacteria bacterium]|jgi:trehalose 6-phosphate phosphatase|nr:trehalose-phosphatase [Deltaproteobacteria bacterium]
MNHSQRQIYLFSKPGLRALRTFIDAATLFAFDLDGTLAAIVDDPQQIEISMALKRELNDLKTRAATAVITGRSREDAQGHLGFMPDYLVGNHGAEGVPGWEKRPDTFRSLVRAWDDQLHSILPQSAEEGIVIENKGNSLSIHYRNALQRLPAKELVLRAVDQLNPKPKRLGGKCVVNLLPEEAPDKGEAVLELMRRGDYRKVFFAGDDLTDEDVFRLRMDALFTVRIGPQRQSEALYYLKDQQEMLPLLRSINGLLREVAKKTENHPIAVK